MFWLLVVPLDYWLTNLTSRLVPEKLTYIAGKMFLGCMITPGSFRGARCSCFVGPGENPHRHRDYKTPCRPQKDPNLLSLHHSTDAEHVCFCLLLSFHWILGLCSYFEPPRLLVPAVSPAGDPISLISRDPIMLSWPLAFFLQRLWRAKRNTDAD